MRNFAFEFKQGTLNKEEIEKFTEGYYSIGEKYYENVNTIRTWSYSSVLNTGYNVDNTIRIEYMGSNSFYVYVNNIFLTNFSHSRRTGGTSGFFATIGNEEYENFPGDPVDVRFKKLQPDQYPARGAADSHKYINKGEMGCNSTMK
jgi:hypothetical protein